MKNPASWWENSGDSSGHQLHTRKIHSVHFQKRKNQNYWQLQLGDVDEPDLYVMRYDAVLKYADETCPSYSSFRLPAQLVPSPINETATIPAGSESKSSTEYVCTNPVNWTVLNDGEDDRAIEPIPFTGESEEFLVKIKDEELPGLKDDNGDIWFRKVMEFCLPRFYRDVLDNGAISPERPHIGLWEWQANGMGN